jgi:hypothetical protein
MAKDKFRQFNYREPETRLGQNGVSLIIVFFIMIIILSVVLSISALLYSEVKVIRNIGNSVAGLYAADSGIEKVLYYDRQVKTLSNNNYCASDSDCTSPYGSCNNNLCTMSVQRGLCLMLNSSLNPTNYCAPGSNGETSIYCNNPTPASFTGGCDANNCTNCTISFDTTFDGRKYYTTAKVYPDADPKKTDPDYVITSKGVYGGAQRQIQILINPSQ